MEYLAEAGDIFFDSGSIVTLKNDQNNHHQPTHTTNWWSWSSQTPQSSSLPKKEKSSVLARKVEKRLPGGDHFSGLVDIITGKPLEGTRKYNSTGDVYEGPFWNGKRHGDGAVCARRDGSKFVGSYRDDRPKHGTLITPIYTYRGSFLPTSTELSLIFHGDNATLIRKNGDTYEGEFYHGFYHGCGRDKTSKYEYKGEFKEGKRHGMGTLAIPLGDEWRYKYSGKWEEDVREGNGSETLAVSDDGEMYASSFTGHFHLNKRNGPGSLTLFDGTVIEGTWRGGLPVVSVEEEWRRQPMWKITFPNGDVYVGECRTLAVPTDPERRNECEILRLWRRGEPRIIPHGHGTVFYASSGDVYTGQFCDLMRHGYGIYICQTTGEEFDGMWENDGPQTEFEADGTFTELYLYRPVYEDEECWSEEEDIPLSSLEDTIAWRLRIPSRNKRVNIDLIIDGNSDTDSSVHDERDSMQDRSMSSPTLTGTHADIQEDVSLLSTRQDDVEEEEEMHFTESLIEAYSLRDHEESTIQASNTTDYINSTLTETHSDVIWNDERSGHDPRTEEHETPGYDTDIPHKYSSKTPNGTSTPVTMSSSSSSSLCQEELDVNTVNQKLKSEYMKREVHQKRNESTPQASKVMAAIGGKAVFTVWTRLQE